MIKYGSRIYEGRVQSYTDVYPYGIRLQGSGSIGTILHRVLEEGGTHVVKDSKVVWKYKNPGLCGAFYFHLFQDQGEDVYEGVTPVTINEDFSNEENMLCV